MERCVIVGLLSIFIAASNDTVFAWFRSDDNFVEKILDVWQGWCLRSRFASHPSDAAPTTSTAFILFQSKLAKCWPSLCDVQPIHGLRVGIVPVRYKVMPQPTLPVVIAHGATHLPSVDLDSYNVEIEDDEGFIGDRASKGAFRTLIENARTGLRKMGADPFGEDDSEELSKKRLDELVTRGDPEAAGIIQGAIEEFSQEFALIVRRFLKLKEWKDTQRLVVGGGFRASRIGEIVIGRTAVILKTDGIDVDLIPIHNHPDEAGLMGAVHLAPSWMFKAFDAVLGVDIGGTNIRAGVVQLNLKNAGDLSKTKVWKFSLWRHGDEEGVKREYAVESLGEMLKGLIAAAKKKGLKLAPFIGIGCPGIVDGNGSIERGAQNLPGNWESSRFNLPQALHSLIPVIADEDTSIVLHNDAVVQGLSEVPHMSDVERWGIFTIGTGLGNARFTNRNSTRE